MGVRLLLVDTQYAYVHFSDGIFGREKRLDYEPIDETKATVITCADSRSFLERLGISGEIFPVKSHSEDSVAAFLNSGECIAGDLEPIEYLAAY